MSSGKDMYVTEESSYSSVLPWQQFCFHLIKGFEQLFQYCLVKVLSLTKHLILHIIALSVSHAIK